jgi:hypothetical protein
MDLSRLFSTNSSTVSRLIEKNKLFPEKVSESTREKKKAQGDLYSAIDFYKIFSGKNQKKESISLEIEKAKLARSQRMKTDLERTLKEIEVGKVKKEIIDIEEIGKEWTKIILSCKSKLLSIPNRLALEANGQSQIEIEKISRRLIEEALLELSKDGNEENITEPITKTKISTEN